MENQYETHAEWAKRRLEDDIAIGKNNIAERERALKALELYPGVIELIQIFRH